MWRSAGGVKVDHLLHGGMPLENMFCGLDETRVNDEDNTCWRFKILLWVYITDPNIIVIKAW